MPDNRRELVRLVTDPDVVGQSDPFALADLGQPVFVGTVGQEVIEVAFDGKARALRLPGRRCRGRDR